MSVRNPFSFEKIDTRPESPFYELRIKGYKKKISAAISKGGIRSEEAINIFWISNFLLADLEGNFELQLDDDNNPKVVPPFNIFSFSKLEDEYSITYTCLLADILNCEEILYAPQKFLDAVKLVIDNSKSVRAKYRSWSLDGKIRGLDDIGLIIEINTPLQKTIGDCIDFAREYLQSIVIQAQLKLNCLYWDPMYDRSEKRFSQEVILPLLQNMGFQSINYNHGIKEYGKDFTFRDVDKFGQMKYYGIQVKVGNISGKVNSQIDTIIGQIEDAFTIPFYELNSINPQYVSTLIIVTSKYFTENAREKIMHKIRKGLYGSIYFFDKNKIQELIKEYWNT